ncbi:site-specific integrase [Conexibacter sp. CPCC 206217]|uniref:tyrosine-type recombinase/integrase n=1 Tax=Conexibacter sp. CPCC 206217 TaxID=3064574 RepID=UPI00271A436C|nr:site-specific integrase [Conexibacter sp. CPCC 206217]MDO8213540.1 site-specific integrase [Conexibacter sp. CPCC 206217]
MEVRRGGLRAATEVTFEQYAERMIAGIEDGSWRTRSGRAYAPATGRSYVGDLRNYWIPSRLRSKRLSAIRRQHVQAVVDELTAEFEPKSVRNKVAPVQRLFKKAVRDGLAHVNPTADLELPGGGGRRDRIVTPAEGWELVKALPVEEQALWAVTLTTGLRRGELRALRWSDVDDLASRDARVHVRRSWDDVTGAKATKTESGRRSVPLIGPVRVMLAAHKLRTGRRGDDLVFGRQPEAPFTPSTVRNRALAAWEAENARRRLTAEEEGRELRPDELLVPIGLHELRHCAASYLIKAGVKSVALSSYMGHRSTRTTEDVYGHLMPDDHIETAAKLEALFADVAKGS